MTPIGAFGWQDAPSTVTPLTSANMEAFGAFIGAYADSKTTALLAGASAHLVPSGGDDSTQVASALTSFAPFASPSIVLGPGTFLWNSTVPLISRATPSRILGAGQDQTFVKLSLAAPKMVGLNKIADDDTFSGIEISDLTVDGNNIIPATNQDVVFGTYSGSSFTTNINIQHVKIARVRTINVPTSLNGAYFRRNVTFGVQHAADNRVTQNVINDILLEDCRFEGGQYGGSVVGVSPGNVANIKYDNVRFIRCYHDSMVVPIVGQAASAASWFVGSASFGGSAYMEDCYGANSRDLCYEMDNATTGAYVRCIAVDAWNAGFLARNFRSPADLAAQVVRHDNCTVSAVNLDFAPAGGGTGAQGAHFSIGGDSSTANFVFGRAVYRDCTSIIETAMTQASLSGVSLLVNNVQVREVVINGMTVAAPSLNVNLAGNILPCFVDIRTALAGSVTSIDGVTFKFSGARAGAFTFQWRMVRVGQANGSMSVRNIVGDIAGISGLSANDTFIWLMIDRGGSAMSMNGTIDGIRLPTTPGSGTHNGVQMPSTAVLTIPNKITMAGCDFALAPATGTDYSIDATQSAKTEILGWVGARTGAHGPLQIATSISPTGSVFTYTNNDSVRELVTITGGTVTVVAITVAGAGGTVTMPGTSGDFLLRPGDAVAVTYTGAPTMTKRPAV